jgi:hypothetical protein
MFFFFRLLKTQYRSFSTSSGAPQRIGWLFFRSFVYPNSPQSPHDTNKRETDSKKKKEKAVVDTEQVYNQRTQLFSQTLSSSHRAILAALPSLPVSCARSNDCFFSYV